MAEINQLILNNITEMRQDFRDHREETNEKFEKFDGKFEKFDGKFEQILDVQKTHNDFMVEQKTGQSIFKWVASVGGISGFAALFKSFIS